MDSHAVHNALAILGNEATQGCDFDGCGRADHVVGRQIRKFRDSPVGQLACAAPDLLAACKASDGLLSHDPEKRAATVALIARAISKAEGR